MKQLPDSSFCRGGARQNSRGRQGILVNPSIEITSERTLMNGRKATPPMEATSGQIVRGL